MVALANAAEYFSSMNKFKDSLSARSKNGISRCFGPQYLDTPEVIAEAGSARLQRTNEIGSKSLQEIAELLYNFEYIGCSYGWLALGGNYGEEQSK